MDSHRYLPNISVHIPFWYDFGERAALEWKPYLFKLELISGSRPLFYWISPFPDLKIKSLMLQAKVKGSTSISVMAITLEVF